MDYWEIMKIINLNDFQIKVIFFESYLGSAGSGMPRNVLLSYFLPVVRDELKEMNKGMAEGGDQ